MPERKKRKLLERLRDRYRLVVMNDDTFEEKVSLKLSPLSLFMLFGSVTIVFITIIISLVAFTPLREYIPGYTDVNMRKELVDLTLKADSMEQSMEASAMFIDNINNIFSGKVSSDSNMTRPDTTKKYQNIQIKRSKEDSLLRKQIESQDKYSLNMKEDAARKNSISSFFFFSPIRGLVTSSFNAASEHYGVDVTAPENEAIKATLDGTVVLASWTLETGYVIQVQHSNNLVSVYKHNSALLKKAGEFIKAGEPIAIIGSSGEQSTGPHLHFELWYNGSAVDPQDYIVF